MLEMVAKGLSDFGKDASGSYVRHVLTCGMGLLEAVAELVLHLYLERLIKLCAASSVDHPGLASSGNSKSAN
jgi:hypothetical protein